MPHRPRTDGKPPRTKRTDKGSHPAVTTIPADSEDGRGRPQVVIDEVTLFELARTHASFEHMAKILGCSGQFLSVHPTYREIIDRARAECKKDLLAAQLSAAITDRNPTMLIWMGKQLLDQKDVTRTEQTGPDGKPQQIEHQFKAVAYFPANNRNRALPPGSATITDGEGHQVDIEAELEEAPEDQPPVATRRRRAS